MTSANNRQFDMHIEIQASRDAVWAAISEAREIARWFAPTVKVTPGEGGAMLWQWGDTHTWKHTIETWKPGECLRTRYDSSVADGRGGQRPLFVEFRLEGRGGATTLRVVHSGFGPEADFDAEFDGISAGWPVELRSLRLYLENHHGKDRRLAWRTRSTQADPDVIWRRLVGADGLHAPGLASIPESGPFEVAVAGAGPIAGTALFSPTPHEFSGIARNLGNGWFRVHCDRWAGATQVWLWLALYEQVEQALTYERAFDALLDRVVK